MSPRLPCRCPPGVLLVCAVLSTACGDSESSAPPRAGQVQISVSMMGVDLPAGFAVVVAGRSVEGTAARGATVAGLSPGSYSLTLRVARNCQVAGDNPRAVTVQSGQSTGLAFSIMCVASTGGIRVKTVTTGVDLDPDGYQLRIDGYTLDETRYLKDWATGANETQILSAIPIGETHVRLSGLSINCDPTDAPRSTVFVAPAETVTVAFTLSCAPDTAQVAYVAGTSPGIRHIFVITATASRVRRLTADDASDEDPAWSPDGQRIALTTDRDGNREIYVADADGSNGVRLTNDTAADYEPAWSRDGKKIAFVSERTGNAEIYAMNADGSNLARLTTSTDRKADPAWSPDGRIAFSSDKNGRPEIYVMNADGSALRGLTNWGGAHPTWSPDGTMLAYSGSFCTFDYCYPSIFIWGSSEPAALDGEPGERPTWSPDGRKIAYSGLECDFTSDYDGNITGISACVASVVRIGRLDQPGITAVAPGSHPAWRP